MISCFKWSSDRFGNLRYVGFKGVKYVLSEQVVF